MQEFIQDNIFKLIGEVADNMQQKCLVIGGYVRDCIMGTPSKDIDVVVEGSGIELAKQVAQKLGKAKINVYKNFGTAMIRTRDVEIEFVGARKESYDRSSRKPVVEDGTLEDDQKRRDFTINAMGISLNKSTWGKLVDPFNGIEDIEKSIIRTPLDPDITYSDDPLRMFRAIRFATRFNFKIEENSFNAIIKNAERIKILSTERIIEEVNKTLQTNQPSDGFLLWEKSGLLSIFFPEFQKLKGVDRVGRQAHKDNFYHTLEVLDNVAQKSDKLWLRWAAVMHDIGKPTTKKYDENLGWTFHAHEFIGSKMVPPIFRRLKLSTGASMKYVQKLVQLHLRPIALVDDIVSDSAVRRLLFDAGDDIDDLMLLCEADITSKNDAKVKRYLENFQLVRHKLKEIEEKDAVRNFQPPVSGEVIMDTFGITPCREVGIIKDAIKEAILDGEIHNDYEEAFAMMLRLGQEIGLEVKG